MSYIKTIYLFMLNISGIISKFIKNSSERELDRLKTIKEPNKRELKDIKILEERLR